MMMFVRVTLLTFTCFIFIMAIKFPTDSFSEIDALVRKGKDYLESINEKANVPHYGTCWKSAVADLEIGCRYLSENVQSNLALRFTNCFMQMSGLEPVVCRDTKEKCLKSLTDRAFNTFVEFYTHTQSMCYFLQNQIWHEEAEKTIEKLSVTSMHVSDQLEEAGRIQEELLTRQKQTLVLQHDLLDYGKNLAAELEFSRDRINIIMRELQRSTEEQRTMLFDLFGKFSSLKSWAMKEMSWLNSITFYVAAAFLSYFFTSTSRTQQARLYLFLLLTLNYIIEQYLHAVVIQEASEDTNLSGVSDAANSLVWLCRKVFVFLCVMVIIVAVFKYCDYDIVNYHLLLEIKNQNLKLLKQFQLNITQNGVHHDNNKPTASTFRKTSSSSLVMENYSQKTKNQRFNTRDPPLLPYQQFQNASSPIIDIDSPSLYNFKSKKKFSPEDSNYDTIDHTRDISKSLEDNTLNKTQEEPVHYNLRSSRFKTKTSN